MKAYCFFFTPSLRTGHAFSNVGRDVPIYPAVGLRTQGECVRTNFGQKTFVYDIMTHVHNVQEEVWKKIQNTNVKWTIDDSTDSFTLEADDGKSNGASTSTGNTSTGNNAAQNDTLVKNEVDNATKAVKQEPVDPDHVPLVLPPDYQEPLNKLIMSYLTHHGYEKTARAFQAQVQTTAERKAEMIQSSLKHKLAVTKMIPKKERDVDVKMEEDEDCARLSDVLHVDDGPFDLDDLNSEKKDDDFHTRQRIVNAVNQGDVDLAIKLAEADIPQVLIRDNGIMLLKLRCRKFVELILASSEAEKRMNGAAADGQNKHNNDISQIKEEGAMEVDDDDGDLYHNPSAPVNGHTNGTTTTSTIHKSTSSPSLRSEYQQILNDALNYGRNLQYDYKSDLRPEVQTLLKKTFALMMFRDPLSDGGEEALVAGVGARNLLAQELNQAILGRCRFLFLSRVYAILGN